MKPNLVLLFCTGCSVPRSVSLCWSMLFWRLAALLPFWNVLDTSQAFLNWKVLKWKSCLEKILPTFRWIFRMCGMTVNLRRSSAPVWCRSVFSYSPDLTKARFGYPQVWSAFLMYHLSDSHKAALNFLTLNNAKVTTSQLSLWRDRTQKRWMSHAAMGVTNLHKGKVSFSLFETADSFYCQGSSLSLLKS